MLFFSKARQFILFTNLMDRFSSHSLRSSFFSCYGFLFSDEILGRFRKQCSFVRSRGAGTTIFRNPKTTLQKSNIYTKNCHFWRELPFPTIIWVSMLVFWGVFVHLLTPPTKIPTRRWPLWKLRRVPWSLLLGDPSLRRAPNFLYGNGGDPPDHQESPIFFSFGVLPLVF